MTGAGGLFTFTRAFLTSVQRERERGRGTAAVCERSFTVNVSLAVSTPATPAETFLVPPSRAQRRTRNRSALKVLTHPNGNISVGNDAPPWPYSSPTQIQLPPTPPVHPPPLNPHRPPPRNGGRRGLLDVALPTRCGRGLKKWISAPAEGKYDVAAAECLLRVLPNLIWKHLGEPACSRNQ